MFLDITYQILSPIVNTWTNIFIPVMDTATEEFESSLGTLSQMYDKYLDDPDFHYTEFAKRDKGRVNVLRAQVR